MRYCTGAPPIEHQLEFKCDHCKFSSNTNNGLQCQLTLHLSVSRKSLYNETLKEKEKNCKRTGLEREYLAATIIELKQSKTRNVNKVTGEKLGRTEQAIQKIRTGSEYKCAERKVKEQLSNHKLRVV